MWNTMKYYEILWNTMKYYEILWNTMKYHEILKPDVSWCSDQHVATLREIEGHGVPTLRLQASPANPQLPLPSLPVASAVRPGRDRDNPNQPGRTCSLIPEDRDVLLTCFLVMQHIFPIKCGSITCQPVRVPVRPPVAAPALLPGWLASPLVGAGPWRPLAHLDKGYQRRRWMDGFLQVFTPNKI